MLISKFKNHDDEKNGFHNINYKYHPFFQFR